MGCGLAPALFPVVDKRLKSTCLRWVVDRKFLLLGPGKSGNFSSMKEWNSGNPVNVLSVWIMNWKVLIKRHIYQVHMECTDEQDNIRLEGPPDDVEQAKNQLEMIVKDLVSLEMLWLECLTKNKICNFRLKKYVNTTLITYGVLIIAWWWRKIFVIHYFYSFIIISWSVSHRIR